MRWGHAGSAEGVGAQSGKGAHSTKDGNPYGWLALGRGARGRGFGGQSTFIWLEEYQNMPEHHIRFTILSQ